MVYYQISLEGLFIIGLMFFLSIVFYSLASVYYSSNMDLKTSKVMLDILERNINNFCYYPSGTKDYLDLYIPLSVEKLYFDNNKAYLKINTLLFSTTLERNLNCLATGEIESKGNVSLTLERMEDHVSIKVGK